MDVKKKKILQKFLVVYSCRSMPRGLAKMLRHNIPIYSQSYSCRHYQKAKQRLMCISRWL